MADQKISQLNELTSPLSGDTLPIVNNGETKKISVSNLLSSNTGSYATTGSNRFIGNQNITGSLIVSGSNIEFTRDWPAVGSESHFLRVAPFTSSLGRQYDGIGIGVEHWNDGTGTYEHSLQIHSWDSHENMSYGAELNVGPYRTHMRIYPSGSGNNLANISVEELSNGETQAIVYGDIVQIGALHAGSIVIGNTGSTIEITGSVKLQNDLEVDGGITGSLDWSNIINIPSFGTGSTYEEVTYSELYSSLTGATLTPGKHYLITDFKTCYDQPDYDHNGNTIETGNYKQGNVAPILVLATDVDKISEHAYQPEYSGDTIQYDPYFTSTEVTAGAAFGRITYRIDDKGNAFDYDFREVLFKRYNAYSAEEIYVGKVSINSVGVVTGVGTNFTGRTTGEVIGIVNADSAYGVNFYQIVSIDSETSMTVTGRTIYSVNNTFYTDSITDNGMSYKQNNIFSNTGFTQYKTFTSYDECFNNTCGNRVANTIENEDTFLLPNNVFRDGPYRDNSFGSNFRNNTFNDDCVNNTINADFYNNIIDNDFDNNTISSDFHDNIIICDFQNNIIQGNFYNNNLGDDDEEDFGNNLIMDEFYGNFYNGDDSFANNILKSSFYRNIILESFENNVVGNFNSNFIKNSFDNNTVGNSFYTNIIYNYFNNNTIGFDFHNNTLGTIDNQSTFENNHIGNEFKANLIVGQFDDNKIGNDFGGNEIGTSFLNNNIGNTFESNDIGEFFEDNFILNNFVDNGITDDFRYNQIGNNFQNNNIGEGFGFGGSDSRGNVIGNYFSGNTIGEYFYNNNIGDNFDTNTVGNDFQFNRIETPLNGIDFTFYLGNPIDPYSYPSTTGTDGVYTGVTGTSSGAGVNSVFTITVASTLVSNVETSTIGKLYLTGDTITIASGSFGGTSDLVLTVDAIGEPPMVYGDYNKTIQKTMNGTLILTALNNSGSLYTSPSIIGALT